MFSTKVFTRIYQSPENFDEYLSDAFMALNKFIFREPLHFDKFSALFQFVKVYFWESVIVYNYSKMSPWVASDPSKDHHKTFRNNFQRPKVISGSLFCVLLGTFPRTGSKIWAQKTCLKLGQLNFFLTWSKFILCHYLWNKTTNRKSVKVFLPGLRI